jgi:hypothetical protein
MKIAQPGKVPGLPTYVDSFSPDKMSDLPTHLDSF